MRILVTGGAGYIGAHVVRTLQHAGHAVAALDDLSTGSRNRLSPDIPLFVGSLLDGTFMESSLRAHSADAVVHIAAKKAVEESVADPLYYYRENLVGMHRVLSAMVAAGTTRILFSSSAAVYGIVSDSPVTETSPTVPSSPYGWTKLMGEQMIHDVAAAHRINWSALRYFNVAGTAEARLADGGENNLIPKIFRAITAGQCPKIYGNTYPTPDGTCIRDYVHVQDVADAHATVIDHLATDELSGTYNVGTGAGTSVLEVMATVRHVTGIEFSCDITAPRPGDPAEVVADTALIRDELGWESSHDLAGAVESAWRAWSA